MGYREVCQKDSKGCELKVGPQEKFEALNEKESEQATGHRVKGHHMRSRSGSHIWDVP